MTFAASSLIIALLAPNASVLGANPSTPAVSKPAPVIRIASANADAPSTSIDLRSGTLAAPRWAFDAKRPAALPAMYVTSGVLQALDLYSTHRALASGATELNPVLAPGAKNTMAMAAVKGASTALSIYFAERAWKKNRKGAVVLMGVLNGFTAAVVANNLHNAR